MSGLTHVTRFLQHPLVPTRFDDHDFPLLRLHAQGESSDADVEARIAFLQRQLDRREKLALVFDTTGSEPISARQRKMWTDWLMREDPRIRRYLVGVAFVVTSALVRGVFTGVFWVWRPPMPYAFVATIREADAWARERLGAVRSG